MAAIRFQDRHGFVQNGLLQSFALAVQLIQLGREGRRLLRVVCRQQARAKVRAPDPAAGIDAWPKDEACVEGGHRPTDLADVGEGLQTRIGPP